MLKLGAKRMLTTASINFRPVDCKALSEKILNDVKETINRLKLKPQLQIIKSTSRPDSDAYIRRKKTLLAEVGIDCIVHDLSSAPTAESLLNRIGWLNADPTVRAILVQMPLAEPSLESAVMSLLDPAKDVDGFHPVNVLSAAACGTTTTAGRTTTTTTTTTTTATATALPTTTTTTTLAFPTTTATHTTTLALPTTTHTTAALPACTPAGIMALLEEMRVDLSGMDAVVVGKSRVVGLPLSLRLLEAGATVTVCHRSTQDLADKCRRAELLVVAAGCPGLIGAEHVRPGAIVIDVGINSVVVAQEGQPQPQQKQKQKRRIVGDVRYEEVRDVAAFVTPVPGGVGLLTVACLARNVLTCHISQGGNH